MNERRDWSPDHPLLPGERTIIEASAGTGKTWQIEGIVVRLVAEAGVPIERIVAITFTEAAAADLRFRIRRRIAAARAALAGGRVPADDEVVARLADADVDLRRARLECALADYDRAPISTIHGFCWRLLEQLAFEADQEPGLEVTGAATDVIERLVADELERVLATVTLAQLRFLGLVGWCDAHLRTVAFAMTGPVAPRLLPPPVDGLDALGAACRWTAEVEDFRAWRRSAAGHRAMDALEADAAAPPGRRLIQGIATTTYEKRRVALEAWLDDGGSPADIAGHWSLEIFDASWRGTEATCLAFPGREVYRRVTTSVELWAALAPAPLASFGARVRAANREELRRRAALSFDGMLDGLASRLVDAGPDHPLVEAVRARYSVALVDEFQDTDGAQWAILRALFSGASAASSLQPRLFTIGDPKQAIYGFRSADLDVYLEACAGPRFDLRCSFRADRPLVGALNTLWGRGRPFGSRIDYVDVEAEHPRRIEGLPDLVGPDGPRPRRAFELRWFDGRTLGRDVDAPLLSDEASAFLAQECARECQRLLASGATVDGEGIAPQHIGVLVRANWQAEQVRTALAERGIPAVAAGRGSVYATEAAAWIDAWLRALASGGEAEARWLALTPLAGWSLQMLGETLDADARHADRARDWDDFRAELAGQAETWGKRGFAGALERATRAWATWPRVLWSPNGERAGTDLRHLVELLHAEERRTRGGPRALVDWLATAASEEVEGAESQPLRLESAARAVQIVTMHKSKGLEYPICLVPFTTEGAWKTRGPVRARVPTPDGSEPCLCVAPEGVVRDQVEAAAETASAEEAMRLLYVTLTRARHHVVAWLGAREASCPLLDLVAGPVNFRALANTRNAARRARQEQNRASVLVAERALTELADASSGTIGWSREAPETPTWNGRTTPGIVTPAEWPAGRELATGWMVSSYSSLAAGRGLVDEPSSRTSGTWGPEGGPPPAPDSEPGEFPVPALDPMLTEAVSWPGAPAGPRAGEWVHALLERLDFAGGRGTPGTAKDGRSAEALAGEFAERLGLDRAHAALATRLLPGWLDTPLDTPNGRLPTGFSLRDLGVLDRLDELGFDLRVGSGARRAAGVPAVRIDPEAARVAFTEGLGDRPLGARRWAETLAARPLVLPRLTGILTGYVDLVFRVGGTGAEGTYFVVDYKSTRITTDSDVSPRGAYARPWLEREMDAAAYHLQALVYTVALHRLLRQRLGGAYRYERHVGGHLFLFLRGMTGDGVRRDGAALGVYEDRWPERVVRGLDAAMDGADREGVRAAMAGAAS